MKSDDKEANISDFQDRLETMAENWADDLRRQEGVPYNEGIRMAEIAIRRAAKEGLNGLMIEEKGTTHGQ